MENKPQHHEHPALKFFVNDEEIDVHAKSLTVREILDDAGCKPAEHYYLLAPMPDGKEAKYVDLDVTVELHGGEHFIAKRREREEYFYFVDGDKYESQDANTTGAIIKSKLPEAKRGYALYLEGHGNQPDQLINDDTSIDLKGDPPKRFYTVPPASFGHA